jgi:hypothetical protein
MIELTKRQKNYARKCGVTEQEYATHLESGNRWCNFGRHFAPLAEFYSDKSGCCKAHNTEAAKKSQRRVMTQPKPLQLAEPPALRYAEMQTTNAYGKRPGKGYAQKMANTIF